MKKSEWQKIIKGHCEELGTYKDSIEPIIETLASVLEKRDAAEADYKAGGSQAIIERISDRGAKNSAKNPLLQLIMDLNAQALAFWKELGCTPASLKKLNADALTAKATADGFEQLLAKIGQ